MGFFKKLIVTTGTAAVAANVYAYYWAQPKYHTMPEYSGPVTTSHNGIRHVAPGSPVVAPENNPGVRLYDDFISPKEREQLLKELQPIKKKYGISLIQAQHAAIYRWQMSFLRNPPQVNMTRITGRHEDEKQVVPPWRYGEQLPPNIKKIADRIRAIPGLNLGKLRDVTINYRHSHFFRLDPHLDPSLDGENICIVGVDSDTVLTLCPLNYWNLTQAIDMIKGLLTMEDERLHVRKQSKQSWTDQDVDVLVRKGGMVIMSADARWTWTHGTRLGVEVDGRSGLHDWFGEESNVVLRNPERHSVVFAFDKPENAESNV
eukprot:CAMPEP_0175039652 /NCGR_PEP_ID=MMETSP0052_2-20121109/735_1 /TAXON_ID=51329 ORGANISM="Polytomella parva, Strain SAG 63-3" /NCGR_SAMPLE_ID=MMETSP0052_2 /ASSEMBLY_ACC=CAM_ASM_000194 /LENGTH=316 /DNA_ID=CAMNT_0016301593 /DNA_START=28 /DNA_END=978 /DNA_ORIENTATION=+